MNKEDLVNEISEKLGLTKKDVESVINTFIYTIKDSVNKGEKVTLSGFGVFMLSHVADKKMRDISTKEIRVIPAHYKPFFKVSPLFMK